MNQRFEQGPPRGAVEVAGDKSVSHRALMFGALAPGTTHVIGANRGADVIATRDAVIALGAAVDDDRSTFTVHGGGLRDPATVLDARNSGTTARLLLGLCAGHGIRATFDGDASLRRRPMERIARPLRAMGAAVETTDGRLPATVRGIAAPRGGAFALELPSAQLKSALLLAQLRATQAVTITGDERSRDHTERMLRVFGRSIAFDGHTVTLAPGDLKATDVHVPRDLSAAAFFLVGATVTRGGDVLIRDVGVNPTRSGILDVLRAMGAPITLERERERGGEPIADIRARSAPLRGIDVTGELVVRSIDEIPLVAVAGAFASGVTRIRDAADLRAKESDRIAAVAATLRACGIAVTEHPDGLDVYGGDVRPPAGALPAFDDHRIAMAIAVLAAGAGPMTVDDARCVDISFPGFATVWANAQGS